MFQSSEAPTDGANRFLDYSAKFRPEYELPVCSTGNHSGGVQTRNVEANSDVSFLAEELLSFRLSGRQVVGGDDYSCAPDRPCQNKACCPKATLQCNYGEEYVFFPPTPRKRLHRISNVNSH